MISVALCTYNGEKYIRQQLDSILSQTMPVDEIIIRDDCSNDATCSIIEEYLSLYSCINYKRNESNLGFAKNFENAIFYCQGDYIFFSDQDDIWDKDKVKKCVTYLQASGMYGVYTDGKLIDQNGNFLGETLFSRLLLTPYIEQEIFGRFEFEILCLRGNHVTGATLAITKSAKEFLLPFKTSKHYLHDMWIAVKLSSMAKLGRIDDPLISYRIHAGQECGLNKENAKDFLIDCFEKKGSCSNLIAMRMFSISPIYLFRLTIRECWKIYSFYKDLYFNNLSEESKFRDICYFIYVEFVVLVKTITGIRIFL